VNLPHGLSLLEQLRPRTYTFNLTQYPFMHFSPEPQYGFVAQEIGSVLPNVTGNSVFRAEYDSTGHMIHDTIQYKSVNYIGIIPVIVAAVQELKAKGDSVTHNLNTKIDSLKQVINNYQSKFNLYDDQLNNLQQMINNCCKVNNNRTKEDPTGGSIPNSNTNYQMVELATENIIILDQNSPNPFEQETDITYYLPETVNNAKIMFYDNSGIIIKAVELNGKGNGALHVYASNLSAGLYTYALIVDGKLIDSKKMVCTKK